MAVRFAPNDPLTPEPLRQRIESWHQNPPKTQFQQYGPLNVYLCIKYPPKAFLVKPQALFRDLWTTDKMEQEDIAAITDILLGGADHTMDIDQKEINRRASLDSQGGLHFNSEDNRNQVLIDF
jgi:hypothetical protein